MKNVAIALLFFATFLSSPLAFSEKCGPNTCSKGTTCCNRGCGICAPEGSACISLFCYWGRPSGQSTEHSPNLNYYDRLGIRTSFASTTKEELQKTSTQTGFSIESFVNLKLPGSLALKLKLGGSSRLGPNTAKNGKKFGYHLGVGLLYRLPNRVRRRRTFDLGLTFDAELRDGPNFIQGLAPNWHFSRTTGGFSPGIVLRANVPFVPVTAFARYIHMFDDVFFSSRLFSAGASISTKDTIPFLPVIFQAYYRFILDFDQYENHTHEFGGGIYYTLRNKRTNRPKPIRIGINASGILQNSPHQKVQGFLVMLLAGWYWDANY